MTTAADAAREFVSGPHVVQAGRQLLALFPLVALCEALGSARPEDAEPLLEALERLTEFEEVRGTFLDKDVVGFLSEGAGAASPRLRSLVAKLLFRLSKSGEASIAGMAAAGLFSLCEPLLLDEETGTSEAAAASVCNGARSPDGPREVLVGSALNDGSSLAERLQNRLSEVPDVPRIRVLSLFIQLGRESSDVFRLLEARGAYEKVLGAFLTDDLLLQLTSVELMDALGSFADGQEFLGRKGVPEKLALELNDPNCDASVRVCLTRVLAAILRRTPAAAAVLLPTQQASFPQSVAMLLDSRDHAEKLCALNSWADASTSLEGLTFFLRWAPLVQEILDLVASTQNEVSKGAMGCWATVLQDRAPPGAIAEVGPESELWDIAVTRLLPMVLQNLKAKPFADVRAHTWGLLSILIRSRRSAQQTLPAQELRDLLLDFHSESASPARIAKHEFVKALVRDHAQLLGNFLDAEVDTLLQEYAKQGPHWVPRAAAVQVGDQAA